MVPLSFAIPSPEYTMLYCHLRGTEAKYLPTHLVLARFYTIIFRFWWLAAFGVILWSLVPALRDVA